MFLKLSSNIVGKLSPNIAIYRLVGTELTGHNPSFTLFLICYFFTHSKVLCPYKVCSLFKNKVYNKALQLFFEKQFFSQNNQWLNNILNSQFIVVWVICFSVRFCDDSLLVLKTRFQVFSFAAKKVLRYKCGNHCSFIYKTVSQLFEIFI